MIMGAAHQLGDSAAGRPQALSGTRTIAVQRDAEDDRGDACQVPGGGSLTKTDWVLVK